jgi:hypothetical protein
VTALCSKRIADVAPVMLQGPSFLSGLAPDELRAHYKRTINSEAAAPKAQAIDALQQVQSGARNAMNLIRSWHGQGPVRFRGSLSMRACTGWLRAYAFSPYQTGSSVCRVKLATR